MRDTPQMGSRTDLAVVLNAEGIRKLRYFWAAFASAGVAHYMWVSGGVFSYLKWFALVVAFGLFIVGYDWVEGLELGGADDEGTEDRPGESQLRRMVTLCLLAVTLSGVGLMLVVVGSVMLPAGGWVSAGGWAAFALGATLAAPLTRFLGDLWV